MVSFLQMSGSLPSDLRTAVHDLGFELQEEYQAGQRIAQQYAQAKAAWTVECTELKSLIGRVRNQKIHISHILRVLFFYHCFLDNLLLYLGKVLFFLYFVYSVWTYQARAFITQELISHMFILNEKSHHYGCSCGEQAG